MKAINQKNQAKFNKCLKALNKYYSLNNMRDNADGNGDEKLFNKLDRQCSNAFDKYLELLSELPKYEQKRIESI